MKINKIKFIALNFILFILINGYSFIDKVSAQCPSHIVPDPLDPDCSKAGVTIGNLVNRFIQILPIIIIVLAVFAILRASIKIILSGGDAEKRNEGLKGLANAGIGLALFFSIWAILFFISQIFDVDILPG